MKNDRYGRMGSLILTGILLVGILGFFLTINFVTPLIGEDYILIVFPPADPPAHFMDLLKRLAARILGQMAGWNVRIGEQLSIIFSCFDKSVFNVLNSLMAVYYLWLVSLYAFPNRIGGGKRRFGIWLAFSSVIILQPALGEIFFWRTGSTNYLWGLCILLTAAFPIRCYVSPDSRDIIGKSKAKTFLLTVLGFFAGLTNENTVVVFLILYIGVIIGRRIQKKVLPIWIYTSFGTLLAGCVIMMEAPSTKHRIAFYNQMFGIENPGMAEYISRIPGVITRFFSDNRYLVLAALACLICGLLSHGQNGKIGAGSGEAARYEPLGWLMLTSVSCGALVMSPYIETRAFLLTDFMMAVVIVYYLELFLQNLDIRKKFVPILSLLLLAAAAPVAGEIYQTYREYNTFCTEREAAIALTDNGKFYWVEYSGPRGSRILTTREDYCMNNETGLEYYFSKDIDMLTNFLSADGIGIENYMEYEAVGYTDWVNYDPSRHEISTGGWYLFLDMDSRDSEIYTYVEAGGKRWYYRTEAAGRPDVADELMDKRYSDCGYQTNMRLFGEMGNESELKTGVYLVNRKKKIFMEIDCGPVSLV